ncbi:unnamed protein product, partial [Laminaria digitata]
LGSASCASSSFLGNARTRGFRGSAGWRGAAGEGMSGNTRAWPGGATQNHIRRFFYRCFFRFYNLFICSFFFRAGVVGRVETHANAQRRREAGESCEGLSYFSRSG